MVETYTVSPGPEDYRGGAPGMPPDRRQEHDMASEGLHEAADLLDEETIDHHRAVTSLCEELEAVDWYDQRVKATSDPTLADVLAHNRDEEKEHASMTLEWLRRRDPTLDRHLRTYLFTTGSILETEAEAESAPGPEEPDGAAGERSGSLGIGSLKGRQS
jgi:ferritin-like protein